ncbi:DUF4179 domain-containing protein [Shimazuella kribbensis]|uniref:DUF4179 domain-containing protein n=1 Tax=Shimazuella kribbensis TaxID=139808 RepID=UPI000409943D|nr:DUF4179 domain-containing protein [Shimazuella kribbensis]
MKNVDEDLKKVLQKEIEIPEVVRQRMNNTFRNLSTKKRSSKRQRFFYATAAAILFTLVTISSGFVSQTMAKTLKQVPLLNRLYEFVGNLGFQAADEKGLVFNVNQTIEKNGTKISIYKVLYEADKIHLTYAIESKKPHPYDYNFALFHKGELISSESEGKSISFDQQKKIVQFSTIFQLNKPLPDSFPLEITVSDRTTFKNNRLSKMQQKNIRKGILGDIVGSFRITIKKDQKYDKTVKQDIPFTVNGNPYRITKAVVGAATIRIDRDTDKPVNGAITDQYNSYLLFDDEGNLLRSLYTDIKEKSYEDHFDAPYKDSDYVTAKFYQKIGQSKLKRISTRISPTKLTTIQYQNGAKLIIQKVEQIHGATLIHYQLQALMPNIGGIHSVRANGKSYYQVQTLNQPSKMGHYNQIALIPSLSTNQPFVIETVVPDTMKQIKEVKIPLTNK